MQKNLRFYRELDHLRSICSLVIFPALRIVSTNQKYFLYCTTDIGLVEYFCTLNTIIYNFRQFRIRYFTWNCHFRMHYFTSPIQSPHTCATIPTCPKD